MQNMSKQFGADTFLLGTDPREFSPRPSAAPSPPSPSVPTKANGSTEKTPLQAPVAVQSYGTGIVDEKHVYQNGYAAITERRRALQRGDYKKGLITLVEIAQEVVNGEIRFLFEPTVQKRMDEAAVVRTRAQPRTLKREEIARRMFSADDRFLGAMYEMIAYCEEKDIAYHLWEIPCSYPCQPQGTLDTASDGILGPVEFEYNSIRLVCDMWETELLKRRRQRILRLPHPLLTPRSTATTPRVLRPHSALGDGDSSIYESESGESF